jgi:Tfp pilus assembly protein PilF
MIGRALDKPWFLLFILVFFSAAGTAEAASDPTLARAQELIDAGRGTDAAALLDKVLEKNPQYGEALFLRSTARFLEGDTLRGRWDLEKSLEVEPNRRQGWLNLGALNLSEGRLDDALEAFQKARALDVDAVDVELNIGAVLLFQGKLEPASGHFERYLSRVQEGAEPYYLVASNYAIAGYAALAVQHLREAVLREERYRLKARTDPAFGPLGDHPALMRLFGEDAYRPPPGAYEAQQDFPVPYRMEDSRLLNAVIDALRQLGMNFDPRVEVTPGWALVWGDVRIKVHGGEEAHHGRVALSAPAERFTPDRWRQLTSTLFAQISAQLQLQGGGRRGGSAAAQH